MEPIDVLRKNTGAFRCLSCGKCTTMCPLAAHGRFAARMIASQDFEDEVAGRGVGVGRCLTCASCQVRCPQSVDFTEFVRGLRGFIPPELRRPCPHGATLQWAARMMTGDTPPADRASWLGDGLRVAEKGKIALFVGCLPFFDEYFRESLDLETGESARAAVRILNRLGIEPVVAADERCCGHDLLWHGERGTFEELAALNAATFAARGVERILTTCAECARTLRLDYPEAVPGFRIEVQHMAEFLAEMIGEGGLSFQRNGGAAVTFQDPCRLGRHLGKVDEPRVVLGVLPGVELREMPRSGRDAMCCGTSGFVHCDAVSRSLQAERLAEASATGAETLVTACPKCQIHFSCALAEDRRRGVRSPDIKIEDLTVLAERLLEGNGSLEQRVSAVSGLEAGASR